MESGNKLVVEARLKGAGMHWAETHVNPMLAIRNILCSQRWKEDWPKIADRLRQQDHLRRSQLHQAHKKNLPPVVVHSPEYVEYVEIPDLPKKLKTNPWRLFKYGKALFQHPASPKL